MGDVEELRSKASQYYSYMQITILTGKRVKDTGSLGALLVHSSRPPPFSSNQIRGFVERRASLGADLVEALTYSRLATGNSILILHLGVIIFCVVGFDAIRGRLTGLFERVDPDGAIGSIGCHDEIYGI